MLVNLKKSKAQKKMYKNSSTNKKMGGLQPVERAMPNLRRSAGNSEGLFLISLEGNVRWPSFGKIALAIFFVSHRHGARTVFSITNTFHNYTDDREWSFFSVKIGGERVGATWWYSSGVRASVGYHENIPSSDCFVFYLICMCIQIGWGKANRKQIGSL